ncbi:DNA adenine methyltransferase YhdJ [bacterium BMS3Bbin04]|nr:DNA adenine methyltransferase YhdJ [bacterium BMS3Bbin04]
MSDQYDNQLYLKLPGIDPPTKNGNGRANKQKDEPSAELPVSDELAIELNTRKFGKGRVHLGHWDNQVLLGDNRELLKSMPDETVDLIVTDPPYNINYKSNRRVVNKKFSHLANDNQGDWIPNFAEEAFRVLKNDRHLYCFCRHDTYPEFIQAFSDAGFKIKRTIIWYKNNHGSGDLRGDYAPQDEWIIFLHKGRRVLNGKRISNIIQVPKLSTKKMTHATEKPVNLLKIFIEKSTNPGELVLDPFAGSGSTMEATRELGRKYCLMEISENYYLTSEKRVKWWNQEEMDITESSFASTMYSKYDD